MDYARFGLHCPAFEETANAAFYCPCTSHKKVVDEAIDGLRNAPGVWLVIGQAGAGKTMLSRHLLERLDRNQRALCLTAAPGGWNSVSKRLVDGFLLDVSTDNQSRRLARVARCIANRGTEGTRYVTIIDDAHHLSTANLAEITELMSRLRRSGGRLAILLLARPAIEQNLAAVPADRMTDLVIRTQPLIPLQRHEIAAYVRHRLRAAGNAPADLFTDTAIEAVAALTETTPRNINAVCDQALERAADQGYHHVSDVLIREAIAARESDNTKAPATGEVAKQLGTILGDAPEQLARMRSAVERLENRASAAVARTGKQLAEMKDQSVRQVHVRANSAKDTQQRTPSTTDTDQASDRLAQFCDRFAEVSESCEQRIALLVTSLDAAHAVHDKLEALGESVSSLVDDAAKSVADERERAKAMFDELRARREELTILLESAGKTQAVQLAQANERSQEQITRIRQSVHDTGAHWDGVRTDINAQVSQARQLIERIERKIDAQKKQLDEIREIERRCAQQAGDAASRVETLTAGLNRAAATTAELDKAHRQAHTATETADAAAANLTRIIARTDETRSRAAHSAEQANHAAQTADKTRTALRDYVERADRVADTIGDVEKTAAERLDAIVHAAEQRIKSSVDQAVARIASLGRGTDQARRNLEKQHEVVTTQLAHAAEQIAAARRNATEALEPIITGAAQGARQIDQARQAALTALDESQTASINAVDHARQTALTALGESQTAAINTVEQAGRAATGSLHDAQRTTCTAIENTTRTGLQTIENAAGKSANDLQQTAERSTLESLKRLSAAAGRHMAQISAHGDKSRQEFSRLAAQTTASVQSAADRAAGSVKRMVESAQTNTDKCAAALASRIDQAQAHRRDLEKTNDTAERRRQEVIVVTQALAGTLDDARKCKEAVDCLIRDVWSMASTVEARTRTLTSLSEQALARNESLRDTIARTRNPATQLNEAIAHAGKTANALGAQTRGTQKAALEFTRRIDQARHINESLQSLCASGDGVRQALQQRYQELTDAIALAESAIESIRNDAATIQATAQRVEQLSGRTDQVQSQLVTVQQALKEPVGIIRDAKAQAEELHGVSLSVKRVFAAVSQATLDANERIKALHALLSGSQQAGAMLEQWITEANHVQRRLLGAISDAPAVNQTHPAVVIPDASDQPLPEILKAAAKNRTADPTRSPAPARNAQPRPAAKSARLSPDDIRQMIADAQSRARDKQLSTMK